MAAAPLTHHEILALVAPFTQRGRHVDLAASDRPARKLAFKPVLHPAAGDRTPALREVLHVECRDSGLFRLIRVVSAEGGPESSVVVDGETLAELLDDVETVPLARQYETFGAVQVARSFRLLPGRGAGRVRAVPIRMHARLPGLDFTLEVSKAPVRTAEYQLLPHEGAKLELGEDLLAVLGWSWGLIRPRGELMRGTLLLRRREPRRTETVIASFDAAARHLDEVLRETPARFHERFTRQRWVVTFRRALPVLVCVGVVAATLGVRFLDLAADSFGLLMAFHAPPLLFAVYFMLPEIPRIEIPPMPRMPTAAAWLTRATSTETA